MGWLCAPIVAVLLMGCMKKNEVVTISTDHFVWGFYDGCDLRLYVEDSICTLYVKCGQNGSFYSTYSVDSRSKDLRCSPSPRGVSRCEELGDVGYNVETWDVVVAFNPCDSHIYAYSQIVSVEICADTVLAGRIPAGTPLNDRFEFLSFSPDEYIRNGYRVDTSRISACRDTLPRELQKSFMIGLPGVKLRELQNHRDVVSPAGREMASVPVYGKLSEIDFAQYECLGLGSSYVGAFRPLMSMSRKEMERLRVKVRYRDGSMRESKVECPYARTGDVIEY